MLESGGKAGGKEHVPLRNNPSDRPETKRNTSPYAPRLQGSLGMILWEGTCVYVSRGDVAVDNTRDDDLVVS